MGPTVAFAAGTVVGLTGLDLAVVTLFGSMPPAVMVFMLALEFSDNADEVARLLPFSFLPPYAPHLVVVSTLGALVSVSVVVTLLRPLL